LLHRRDKSLSRVLCLLSVLLPESFRGGCSFGAIFIVSPDIRIRLLVNKIKSNINYLKHFVAFFVN
jgi:hypothetical protein